MQSLLFFVILSSFPDGKDIILHKTMAGSYTTPQPPSLPIPPPLLLPLPYLPPPPEQPQPEPLLLSDVLFLLHNAPSPVLPPPPCHHCRAAAHRSLLLLVTHPQPSPSPHLQTLQLVRHRHSTHPWASLNTPSLISPPLYRVSTYGRVSTHRVHAYS